MANNIPESKSQNNCFKKPQRVGIEGYFVISFFTQN